MAARFATVGYTYVNAAGASVTILPGVTRDSVTDATEIAIFAANWTATVPTAATIGQTLSGWEASYPKGQVS
jgi:hypothetical protein